MKFMAVIRDIEVDAELIDGVWHVSCVDAWEMTMSVENLWTIASLWSLMEQVATKFENE